MQSALSIFLCVCFSSRGLCVSKARHGLGSCSPKAPFSPCIPFWSAISEVGLLDIIFGRCSLG